MSSEVLTDLTQRLNEVNYALAKQVPEDSDVLTITGNYGEFTLDGIAARAAITAIRHTLKCEAAILQETIESIEPGVRHD